MRALEIRGILRSTVQAVSARLWSEGTIGLLEGYLPGTQPAPLQPWETCAPRPEPDRIVLTAWFESPSQAELIAALSPWLDEETELVWRDEPEVDWVTESQAKFPPITIGSFVIAPPWNVPEGAIIIDPGSGFGTGDHPTTQQMLTLFEGLHGDTLLDIGCGSGVLAIAAARQGFKAHGTDIDAAAIMNAKHNAKLNNVDVSFDLRPPDELDPADVVLANIHAEQLIQFAPVLQHLTKDHLLLAGILADREAAVLEAFAFPVARRIQHGEWIALHLCR